MISKKLITTLAAALLSLPAVSLAAPYDGPHGKCPAMIAAEKMPMPQAMERRADFVKSRNEYREAVTPLREKLMLKKMELRALSPNPNVKPEELKALVAEIVSLHKQIQDLNKDFKGKMPAPAAKKAPLEKRMPPKACPPAMSGRMQCGKQAVNCCSECPRQAMKNDCRRDEKCEARSRHQHGAANCPRR